MNSFWKDYSDYIVFPLSVIATALIAFWIYSKEKKKKELSYEELSNSNIIVIENNFKDIIEIYFNNNKIKDLWVLIIKLTNTGTIPIRKEDFDIPISISVSKTSQVIQFEVPELIPSNLPIHANLKENKIEIEPCLLNPNDSFTIRFMITGEKPGFDINGRISGVNNILLKKPIDKNSKISYSDVFKIIFIIISFSWILYTATRSDEISSKSESFPKLDNFEDSLNYLRFKIGAETQVLKLLKEDSDFLNNYYLNGTFLHRSYGSITISDSGLRFFLHGNDLYKPDTLYYNLNTLDKKSILTAVGKNGEWAINLSDLRPKLTTGENVLYYKFTKTGVNYKSTTFQLSKSDITQLKKKGSN